MGKALMVASSSVDLASGDEVNLFGYRTDTTTEANTQASATEAAVFSLLGLNIISGGSGTNNLQFRDAGANGSQLATRAGAGVAEDATNSDTLSAADLFNLAYTDDGTNSTISWIKGNVEFSSGHGCFCASSDFNGAIHDVASATRFIALSGSMIADGSATEANAGFKVRGYDTFEAMQVRVTANARTNDSVFRNRINLGNGTGVITFGTGVTGLLTATGLADAITDGQVINASVALLTGLEDLTVSLLAATLKSSTSKQDVWSANINGLARTASATAHYVAIGGFITSFTAFTEAQARIKPGFAGVASNLRCYLSDNTYASNATLKLYQNGVEVITTTLTASGGAGWYENASDTVSFDADDEFSFELDEGTSGSATFHMIGMTFAPAGGPQSALLLRMHNEGLFVGA